MSSLWNMSESWGILCQAFYYMFISTNWWYAIAWPLLLQTVSLVFLFVYAKESPKWLYDQ